jgi:hypothetical protein
MGAEMDLADDGGSRFSAYVDGLASVIGHKDREGPLRDYCLGLMMPCERKSVEPLAAVTAPARVAAQHQSLLHFVGAGGWLGSGAIHCVQEIEAWSRRLLEERLEPRSPIRQPFGHLRDAWVVRIPAGFPTQGQCTLCQADQRRERRSQILGLGYGFIADDTPYYIEHQLFHEFVHKATQVRGVQQERFYY